MIEQDRRRYRRLNLAIPVTIQGYDATDRAFTEECTTVNISPAGALFLTHRPLRLSLNITLELRPSRPEFGLEPLVYEAQGPVIRVEEAENNGPCWRAAVQFAQLPKLRLS